MEEEAAVEFAKNELKDLGLLPDGDYRLEVDVITSYEKTVVFFHTYNGLEIFSDMETQEGEGEGEGIGIRINKNGLSTLLYCWRDIVPVSGSNTGSEASIIDEVEATELYKKEVVKEHPEAADVVDDWSVFVSPAYRYAEGKSIKIWVFSQDEKYYRNTVFIDMHTGEVVE